MTEVLRAKVLRTEEHKEQKSSKAKESSNKHVRNPVFMKYKKTLQVLIICAVCELYALLFSALIYSCRGEGGRAEMRTEMENAVVTGNNELFHHRGHRVSQSIPLFMRQNILSFRA